jgi:signal transduction histidine kinase
MKFNKTVCNLSLLVHQILNDFKSNIDRSKLNVTLTLSPENYTIFVDAIKIKQVISNLIDNAVKYTPGGGTLSIHTEERGGLIILSIKDSGIGISKEDIPKLFSKFVRADNANAVTVSGTGLGLYVAKEIMEAHNGRIWIESEGVGKGTTFFVEFKKYTSEK